MEYCDVCGARIDNPFITDIEGVRMKVCGPCSKLGKVVEARETRTSDKRRGETVYVTVPDFGSVVRETRVKMEMSPREFARELNERESLIKNLEAEEIEPSLKFADKFYDRFGVKLIEIYDRNVPAGRYKDATLTLGDVVEVKEK